MSDTKKNNRLGHMLKKLTPYNLQKGFRYLKHFGPKEFLVRLSERLEPEEVPYDSWYSQYRITQQELEKQKMRKWSRNVQISIVVPVYKTPIPFLKQMIDSVINQSYGNWELCIANASPKEQELHEVLDAYSKKDSRIRVLDLDSNEGIAQNTNAALTMAAGDYIGLLDHDDLLAPNALYEVASALEQDSDIEVIYTDEDKVTTDLSEHFQPNLKPDFNLDLLRSNNYICHFFLVKTSIVHSIGGFRQEYNGAQDYDFIFRSIRGAKKVHHIPEILYHWRVHKASTADNPASKMYAFEAGRKAIEEDIRQSGDFGEVTLKKDLGFYQVRYQLQGEPLISIIIPNKDEKKSLEKCMKSIRKSSYHNYEIIIVENNSTTEEIKAYYDELQKDERVQVVVWEKEFNYSAINNFGASFAKGEYLLFLNNDVEVITGDWLEQMASNCQRKEVGIVGVKLYYPDNTIQHAGTVIGIGGIAGHMFVNMPRSRSGYMHKASLQMNYSAVTAACMMMKKSVFEEVSGFEEKLSVAFNDVDLCLRCNQAGYLVVYDPYVELYHYESKSRGTEDNPDKVRRFQSEIEFMRTRWEDLLKKGDPYYNKNLSLSKWNYSLKYNR